MEATLVEKLKGVAGKTCGSDASCGHHQFEKATEVLSAEHRIIERVLDAVDRLTQAPLETSLESWKKALDFIRTFADGCHHHKEEKIFFPAIEEHGIPRSGGPIGMMLMEHEEGREYVKSMVAALALAETNTEAAKEKLVQNAKAYLRLLREHIQKEDEILFRMADDVLPAAEQKEILRTFEEHESTEVGTGVHEKYLEIARELEDSVR